MQCNLSVNDGIDSAVSYECFKLSWGMQDLGKLLNHEKEKKVKLQWLLKIETHFLIF